MHSWRRADKAQIVVGRPAPSLPVQWEKRKNATTCLRRILDGGAQSVERPLLVDFVFAGT